MPGPVIVMVGVVAHAKFLPYHGQPGTMRPPRGCGRASGPRRCRGSARYRSGWRARPCLWLARIGVPRRCGRRAQRRRSIRSTGAGLDPRAVGFRWETHGLARPPVRGRTQHEDAVRRCRAVHTRARARRSRCPMGRERSYIPEMTALGDEDGARQHVLHRMGGGLSWRLLEGSGRSRLLARPPELLRISSGTMSKMRTSLSTWRFRMVVASRSQRQTVSFVTPSFWANCAWVSPVRCLSSRMFSPILIALCRTSAQGHAETARPAEPRDKLIDGGDEDIDARPVERFCGAWIPLAGAYFSWR